MERKDLYKLLRLISFTVGDHVRTSFVRLQFTIERKEAENEVVEKTKSYKNKSFQTFEILDEIPLHFILFVGTRWRTDGDDKCGGGGCCFCCWAASYGCCEDKIIVSFSNGISSVTPCRMPWPGFSKP